MNLWTSVGFRESIYISWKRRTRFNYRFSTKSLQEPKSFLVTAKLTKPSHTVSTFISPARIRKRIT